MPSSSWVDKAPKDVNSLTIDDIASDKMKLENQAIRDRALRKLVHTVMEASGSDAYHCDRCNRQNYATVVKT